MTYESVILGNKEILECYKDLAEYRKLDNALRQKS